MGVVSNEEAEASHWTRYVMGSGLFGILIGVAGQLLLDKPVVFDIALEMIGYIGLFLFLVGFLIFVTVE